MVLVDTPLSLAVRRARDGDDPSDRAGWQVPARKMRRGPRAGIRAGKASGFVSGPAPRCDTIAAPGHLRHRLTPDRVCGVLLRVTASVDVAIGVDGPYLSSGGVVDGVDLP